MQKPDLFICPRSKKKLIFSEQGDRMVTETGETSYPIVHEVIDFCPEATNQITEAYDTVSTHYDTFLTNASWFSRLYNKIVWNVRDDQYVQDLLQLLPANLSGILLDVPVGTGVFTAEHY